MHGEARGQIPDSSSVTLLLICLETRSLIEPGTWLDWLASKSQRSAWLCLSSAGIVYRCTLPHLTFYVGTGTWTWVPIFVWKALYQFIHLLWSDCVKYKASPFCNIWEHFVVFRSIHQANMSLSMLPFPPQNRHCGWATWSTCLQHVPFSNSFNCILLPHGVHAFSLL